MSNSEQFSDEQQIAPPPRVRGRPFPKGVSGNPAGRPRGHKSVLRELIGEYGADGYKLIWQIARGELSFEKLVREPAPHEDVSSAALIPAVRVVPSIRERKDAAEFLIEQLNGKATAFVDVTTRADTSNADVSRLSDEQLERLERALEPAFVDAEFEEPDAAPGMLPASTAPVSAVAHEERIVYPVDAETATATDYVWVTEP